MHTGGGYRFWNRPFSQLLDLHDLDLDFWSGHTAYCRVSLIDLCLHTKFRSNRKKNFCGQNWRTSRPTRGVDLKIKNKKNYKKIQCYTYRWRGIYNEEWNCFLLPRLTYQDRLWMIPRSSISRAISIVMRTVGGSSRCRYLWPGVFAYRQQSYQLCPVDVAKVPTGSPLCY